MSRASRERKKEKAAEKRAKSSKADWKNSADYKKPDETEQRAKKTRSPYRKKLWEQQHG